MAKTTLKGKISLVCDLDKISSEYNCEMMKLKQEKKEKALIPGEWTIPTPDMHKWSTEAIRVHSEVELPDPFGGVISRAGGPFMFLIPSDAYMECKTGLKSGRLSLTKCMLKS